MQLGLSPYPAPDFLKCLIKCLCDLKDFNHYPLYQVSVLYISRWLKPSGGLYLDSLTKPWLLLAMTCPSYTHSTISNRVKKLVLPCLHLQNILLIRTNYDCFYVFSCPWLILKHCKHHWGLAIATEPHIRKDRSTVLWAHCQSINSTDINLWKFSLLS